MNKHFIRILNSVDQYKPLVSKTCLWNNCPARPINSHSHSEKYLKKIASNSNTVYALTKSFISHTKGDFFKRFGLNQASTFSGFCQPHDSQLFDLIETCTSISNTSENAFLLYMRSLFFEYHQKILAKKKMAKFIKLCAEQKIQIDEDLFTMFIAGKDAFINNDFQIYSDKIYNIFQKKNYDTISSIYIRLSKKAPIAVTTMICPLFDDYNGYKNIQPLFSLNIIPDSDTSLVSISWLKNDDFYMKQIIDFAKKDADKLINYLTFMETENYYLSPDFYEEHIKKEKRYITGALHNRSYEKGYDQTKILYQFVEKDTEIIFNF